MGRVVGAAASPAVLPTVNPCGPLHGCHMASVLPSVSRLADGGACSVRSVTARTRVGPSARTATCAAQVTIGRRLPRRQILVQPVAHAVSMG